MFNKDKQAKIEFICTVPEIMSIEECLPKPAKYFLPEWWKNMPSPTDPRNSTIRECPGLADWFSQGYVIPMWMDSYLKHDPVTDRWTASSSDKMQSWDFHNHTQFLDYADAGIYGSKASLVFKSLSPWRIITPPGYSVYQMPLFYHFNDRFTVLPGVVDTDIYYEMNQQVLYHGNGEEIFIKRGEPLVLYIPFKRTKYDMVVRSANEEDNKKFRKNEFNFSTSSLGQRIYRKMQRERNKS